MSATQALLFTTWAVLVNVAGWLTARAIERAIGRRRHRAELGAHLFASCACSTPSPTVIVDANGYRRWCGHCGGRLWGAS